MEIRVPVSSAETSTTTLYRRKALRVCGIGDQLYVASEYAFCLKKTRVCSVTSGGPSSRCQHRGTCVVQCLRPVKGKSDEDHSICSGHRMSPTTQARYTYRAFRVSSAHLTGGPLISRLRPSRDFSHGRPSNWQKKVVFLTHRERY